MLEPHLMQDGGVQIVHADAIDFGFVSNFVSFTEKGSTLNAATREPGREGMWIMVTTGTALLDERQPPELSTPNDERFIEQPA